MIYSSCYTNPAISQANATILIEQLVERIERSKQPAYKIRWIRPGNTRIRETSLSKYFDPIQQMCDNYDDRCKYDYSEKLQVFWDACQDIGLERSPCGLTCLNSSQTRYLSFHETMNELVNRIRELTKEYWYKRRAIDRRYEAKQLQAKLTEYVSGVLRRYSRTVVVRIDLHYHSLVGSRLRIERVFDDLDRFIRARERNPIFKHETGYACVVEQGEKKGFHIHAAFFFNGSEVRSDWNKAREIGELWQQITRGYGYFYSCNEDKKQYGDELGIGLVNRTDTTVWSKTIKAVSYLAKDSQHLRIKPAGARTFRTGLLKK